MPFGGSEILGVLGSREGPASESSEALNDHILREKQHIEEVEDGRTIDHDLF